MFDSAARTAPHPVTSWTPVSLPCIVMTSAFSFLNCETWLTYPYLSAALDSLPLHHHY